jgi:hypothetical protein
MASPLGVPGDLRAVSWSSFALRYAFAFTGVRIRLNQFLYIMFSCDGHVALTIVVSDGPMAALCCLDGGITLIFDCPQL